MRWPRADPALWAGAVLAVQPDEVLMIPRLKARARALSDGLRSRSAGTKAIDESTAEVARDIRLFVRERPAGGRQR